jgi:hypothetical protein
VAKFSPLTRSLVVLEAEGFHVEKVRRYHGCQRRSRPMLDFADLLALRDGDLLAVRVLALADPSAFPAGLLAAPALPAWLSKARLEVWCWSKADGRWHLERCPVRQGDLAPAPIGGPRGKARPGTPPAARVGYPVGGGPNHALPVPHPR